MAVSLLQAWGPLWAQPPAVCDRGRIMGIWASGPPGECWRPGS